MWGRNEAKYYKIPEDDDTLNHVYFYVVVELVVDVLKNEDTQKRTHLFQNLSLSMSLIYLLLMVRRIKNSLISKYAI